MIFIGKLVDLIWKDIRNKNSVEEYKIPHTAEEKVIEILDLIKLFKKTYVDKGVFPLLNNKFEINLFNTIRCYMDIPDHYPVKLAMNTDGRGTFVETIKSGLVGLVSF